MHQYLQDIRTINKEMIINAQMPQIDIMAGGFPCQPFSIAGKRKGTKDDRNLFPEMVRLIAEIKPSWVIGENVVGSPIWQSTHYLLDWKLSVTPHCYLLFQLTQSTHRIKETGYLWSPTPVAMEGQAIYLGDRGDLRSKTAIPELGMGNCWINPEYSEWLMGLPQNWTKVN